MFPANNPWNEQVNSLRVRSDSSTLVRNISTTGKVNLHADFGGAGAYGIPFKVVPASQPKVPIDYTAYGDESDPGPFPIPGNAPVEGGSASTATGTCSCCNKERVTCTSSGARSGRATTGTPTSASTGT